VPTSIKCHEHTALTIFAEGKEGPSPHLIQCETRRTDEQFSAGSLPEVIAQRSNGATENITTASRCRPIVMGRLEAEKEQILPPLVCFGSAQIPLEGTPCLVRFHVS
jgi:hypothetical protein